MQRPKDGSRKAQIFDAFMAPGEIAAREKAAAKLATKLDIKPSTLKSWLSEWARRSGETITNASPTIKRERLPGSPETAPKPGEFDPHFRFKSREAAEKALISQARHCGIRTKALTILENDGRFAIAPSWRKGMPIPQFKKGDIVYGMFMVDSKAKVTAPGPEQSMIRYVKESSAKSRPREECVPNYYLWLPSEIEEKPTSKRERL